jgi:hypothetical protein
MVQAGGATLLSGSLQVRIRLNSHHLVFAVARMRVLGFGVLWKITCTSLCCAHVTALLFGVASYPLPLLQVLAGGFTATGLSTTAAVLDAQATVSTTNVVVGRVDAGLISGCALRLMEGANILFQVLCLRN